MIDNAQLKQKYVYSDKLIDALEIAYNTNKNILLYGGPGMGKSQISYDFLKSKGIEPFVFALGNGTSIDRLLGGIDNAEFKNTGKINYLVENSFLNHEYVILEEFLDAPAELLEQTKDILSSGFLRQGGQQFQVKCKLIIVNSNKTRKDFVKGGASLKAVMERFPLELEAKWDNYTALHYKKLITAARGADYADPFLCYILEEYHKSKITISPRIALEAADLFKFCGIDCLNLLGDFNTHSELLDKCITKYKFTQELNKEILNAKAIVEPFEKDKFNLNSAELKKVKDGMNNIKFNLDKLKATDENLEELKKVKDRVIGIIEEVTKIEELKNQTASLEEDAFTF